MMGVIVDDGGMTPDAVQGLMKKASDKGFEWIEMAKKAMTGATPETPAIPAPAPAPASSSSSGSSRCSWKRRHPVRSCLRATSTRH